jgi:hypothetical protein
MRFCFFAPHYSFLTLSFCGFAFHREKDARPNATKEKRKHIPFCDSCAFLRL